jgi:membrane protein implicated in regulation of membrane protease activity
MTFLIFICLAALFWLLRLLRKDRFSLGLPIAYLYSLLLIHVPGGFAHIAGRDFLLHLDLIESGMRFTAIGSMCFVAGVWRARSRSSFTIMPIRRRADRDHFWWFCLLGGWSLIYGLSPLYQIPSISAAVEKGGGIWMLGVMLGLRAACQRRDPKRIAIWLGALLVYPVLMLLLGGFLSYGSAAIIIVCAVLTVSTRSYWLVVVGIAVFSFLSLSIFVNYFQHRKNIRDQVWGGAPLEARIGTVTDMVGGFKWFDPNDRTQLSALDQRLNQNYFVGLAAQRIHQGQVDYLVGASVWQGVLSLIPRAFWPEKPVFAGSPQIVSKMTGLHLSPTTSFGVGNVMEFQINFGVPGVVIGFFVLGWLIGALDLKAAVAETRGDLGGAILFFLPAVALIDPQGSLVEMFSGSAAALVAAYGWKWAWKSWAAHRQLEKGIFSSARSGPKSFAIED